VGFWLANHTGSLPGLKINPKIKKSFGRILRWVSIIFSKVGKIRQIKKLLIIENCERAVEVSIVSPATLYKSWKFQDDALRYDNYVKSGISCSKFWNSGLICDPTLTGKQCRELLKLANLSNLYFVELEKQDYLFFGNIGLVLQSKKLCMANLHNCLWRYGLIFSRRTFRVVW